jgi:hypothetical protein
MYLPPGFDGRKFPLPRTTGEAFASLRSFSSPLAFAKGGDFGDRFSKGWTVSEK